MECKGNAVLKTMFKNFLIILALWPTLQAREISIDNINKIATASQKHLFVWLHKTDCGYCENMKTFTLQSEAVKDFMKKRFIFIHINISEEDIVIYKDFKGTGREFAQSIGHDFYPSSLFFDEKGDITYIEVGYIDSKKNPNEKRFYTILNFIDSKSYKNMSYEDYEFDIQEEL